MQTSGIYCYQLADTLLTFISKQQMIEFLNRSTKKFAAESTNHKPFLIISGPRSGSSYLSSLLRSHPDIISYSELFHPGRVVLGPDHKLIPKDQLLEYRRANPLEFIESIYTTAYSKNVQAVGFKLLYAQSRTGTETGLWNWLDQHNEIRIIHLLREDMLAQFLSIRQALVRRQWTTNKQLEGAPLCIALPDDQCETMFRQTEGARARTRSRFQSHPYLEIEYEDLISDSNATIDKILKFIDAPAFPLSTELVRMNPWPAKECIRNYAELKNRFQNTPWARFFKDR